MGLQTENTSEGHYYPDDIAKTRISLLFPAHRPVETHFLPINNSYGLALVKFGEDVFQRDCGHGLTGQYPPA